jgi:hypothetical protein
MADIWVWEIESIHVAAVDPQSPIERVDVTGFEVEASDGHVGTVDEATYESGRGRLVVDTGFWIFGKKRMIPAGLVTRVDIGTHTVHLGITKEHVKGAPDHDEVRADDDAYRGEVADHYRGLRGDTIGPVAGTGREPGELTGDPIGPEVGIGSAAERT